MRVVRVALLAATCVAGPVPAAHAQVTQIPSRPPGWDVAVYPIYAWIPLFISINATVPPDDGGGGGEAGEILESRFDGAFFGGVTATNGKWYVDAFAVWAAFGGDRLERPSLQVDLDVILANGKLGRRVAPDWYVTAGVRRLALGYDISLGSLPHFSGKPGLWDPLVGLAWHRPGPKWIWHASFDVGGFGVGSDIEGSGIFKVDWRFSRHLGLSLGYSALGLKETRRTDDHTIIVKTWLHGPSFGFGLYF